MATKPLLLARKYRLIFKGFVIPTTITYFGALGIHDAFYAPEGTELIDPDDLTQKPSEPKPGSIFHIKYVK